MKTKNTIKTALLTAMFIILSCFATQAQDVIVKNDKTEIKAKVTEVTDLVIKYKKFEMPNGPVYNINKEDVFMIIYENGTKEYYGKPKTPIQNAPVKNQANTAYDQHDYVKTDQDGDDKKVDNWVTSMAVNDQFTALDCEFNKKLAGPVYLGLSSYSSFSGSPSSGGLYPNIAIKYPLDKSKIFYIWANAGYNVAYVASYYDGAYNIPGTTAGSFLWEIGADIYFSKKMGFTVYSTQASGLWFGFVFKGAKLF